MYRPAPPAAAQALSLILAGIVLAIAVATLVEYALVFDVGIDSLFIRGVGVGPYPPRPSAATTVALVLLALALFLYRVPPIKRVRPAEWLLLAAGVTALIGLMGLLFGAGPLYRVEQAPVFGLALPTALALLTITAGLLMQRPDAGLMRIATSQGPGGTLFRRLGLPAIVGPALIGYFVMKVFHAIGVDNAALATAALASVMIAVSLLFLPFAAVALDDAHAALESTRVRTQALVEQASDGIFVADRTGRYIEVNDAACRMLGMSREELVGKHVGDLVPPDDVDRLMRVRDTLINGGSDTSEWRMRHQSGEYIEVEMSSAILPDGRWQGLARDITERKAADELVHRARARMEGIISLASDAIISFDEGQRITMFNQGAEQVFGWSRADVIGQPLDILLPERFRAQHRLDLAQYPVTQRGGRKQGPARQLIGVRQDGTEFPTEATISRLELGDETIYTVVLRDMTQRVQLERELREARSFLENVLESSTEYSLIALDLDRRVVLWNEGARRNYGFTSAEISGRRLDELHHARDITSGVLLSLFARALDLGSSSSVLHARRKDGSEFIARVAISRRLGEAGTPIGYLVISLDMTREYRRADQERVLAELGPRLTASLDREHMLDSAVDLITQNIAEACIVDLGDTPGDAASIRPRRIVHRDPKKRAALKPFERATQPTRFSRSVIETRSTALVSYVTQEYLQQTAADQNDFAPLVRLLAPVSLVSVPLEARGVFFGALTLISSDPLHRYDEEDESFVDELGRRLALALENARLFEVAEKAVSARDEVLRVVAHDLRNPLATAILAVDGLARPGNERRTATQKLTERIARSLARANRLIEDLLDVTRIESGSLAIEPREVDVANVTRETIDMLAASASASSIELIPDVEPGLPPAWADESRIVQVLGNLVSNALKFTPAGGRVRIGAQRRDGEIELCVVDTGPGLPPDQLSHVFDRFWQAHADKRGAGLGLAIAKGIVDAHHGHIWAESEPGHGSAFRFTLPVAGSLTVNADRQSA